ncbi:hypothetical protein WJX81_007815 [Elliptochloris bilobata]|uniref:16S rRNA 7-methylguanosine methyltransferase n=1 Tax=Elliptochloris bilobata TaxID=381761 RepID=A0AAW1S991_9CHLO
MTAYLGLVMEMNQHMNLTAVQSHEEGMERHIRDSLALLPALDTRIEARRADEAPRVIDVGSGAGFPGVVLALARPAWQVVLLDSLRKRCTFVEGAAATVGAANAHTLWSRAEAAGQDPTHREQADAAVARAVAELRVLAELCLPLVRVGGWWLAAKGARPQAEVEAAQRAIQLLGGELEAVEAVASQGPDGPRTVVVVRKMQPTPLQYPRREGRPAKAPL